MVTHNKSAQIIASHEAVRLIGIANRINNTTKIANRIREAHARVGVFERAQKTKATADEAFEASKQVQPEDI
jgi:hypothetical protein